MSSSLDKSIDSNSCQDKKLFLTYEEFTACDKIISEFLNIQRKRIKAASSNAFIDSQPDVSNQAIKLVD